jgi:hypothetical protein
VLAQANPERSPRENLQELIQSARAPTVGELMQQLSQTSEFGKWLFASNAVAQLEAMPDISIFVPIDAVWPDSLRSARVDEASARQLVFRHITANRWTSVNQPEKTYLSLSGGRLTVDGIRVNDAAIELSGLRVRNGYVHLIAGML